MDIKTFTEAQDPGWVCTPDEQGGAWVTPPALMGLYAARRFLYDADIQTLQDRTLDGTLSIYCVPGIRSPGQLSWRTEVDLEPTT